MNLIINGEEREFESRDFTTIAGLLQALEIEATRGVAVAVGDEVVPRSQWKNRAVHDGDRIEVIRATQGG